MRRSPYIRLVAALAAAVLAIGPVAAPAAHAEVVPAAIPDFTITGGGNGHGIGLSQYGAQGYALNGWTYDAILKHYYQGVSIAKQAKTCSRGSTRQEQQCADIVDDTRGGGDAVRGTAAG